MNVHEMFGRLEPLPNDPAINGPAEAAVVSIAISLKRIADALHGDEQNTGMKHALAEMANRAFNGWGPSS